MNNSDDKSSKVISFFIACIFFIFYIVIINTILNQNILEFPLILLTIYLFISIFTLPFVSVKAGEKSQGKTILLRNRSLILAYLISQIWVIINIFKK